MKFWFAQPCSLKGNLTLLPADVLPGDDNDMVTTAIRHSYSAVTTFESVSDPSYASPYSLYAPAMPFANVEEFGPHPSDVCFDIEDRSYHPVTDDRNIEIPRNLIYTFKSHWLVDPDLYIAWQVDSEPVCDQLLQRGRY